MNKMQKCMFDALETDHEKAQRRLVESLNEAAHAQGVAWSYSHDSYTTTNSTTWTTISGEWVDEE
jgi:cation transport regulator ChaB